MQFPYDHRRSEDSLVITAYESAAPLRDIAYKTISIPGKTGMRRHLKTIAEIADEIGIDKEMIVCCHGCDPEPGKPFVVCIQKRRYLYVMDQISDKRTWKKNWWRIFLFDAWTSLESVEHHYRSPPLRGGKTQMEVADEIVSPRLRSVNWKTCSLLQYAKLSRFLQWFISLRQKLQQNIYPATAFISYSALSRIFLIQV